MGEDVLGGTRVLLMVVGHLANAPRARKEARALVAAGAQVHVRGVWSDPGRVAEDMALAREMGVDYAPVCDLRPDRGLTADRLRQRASSVALRMGLQGPRNLGPGAPETLREALRLRCDLSIAHGEPGLWAAHRLLRHGMRVGVDFEDWFSHDQLEADRPPRLRAWLHRLEQTVLRNAAHASATTEAMASALAADAGGTRRPIVVPNSFEFERAPDLAPPTGTMRFHWFSQTVGPGRGLETLADALPRLRGAWRLSLRGALHGHGPWYEQVFGDRFAGRVERQEPVAVDALPAAVAQHDVGLALEIPYCRNKDLTASNKLFDYMRCGLAVLATDTRGQVEVMSAGPMLGMTVPAGDADALANAMQACIDDPARVLEWRRNAQAAARTTWDFARFESRIVDSVAAALGRAR